MSKNAVEPDRSQTIWRMSQTGHRQHHHIQEEHTTDVNGKPDSTTSRILSKITNQIRNNCILPTETT
jgi:hypothetical protein